MTDDEFEWDDGKAAANERKHGVSFAVARRVFEDVFAIEDTDDRADEFRSLLTGMVDGDLLTVVYTERNGCTRIISARRATRHEQRKYYKSQTS